MIPDTTVYAAYVGTVVLLALAPGTDNIYIMTQTLARGRGAGLLAAAGIALALCIHVTAITLGLSQLFLSAPALYQAVRWAGIAYLGWLAWKAFRSADQATIDLHADAASPHRVPGRAARIVARAFTLALLNPKLAVFFIAFLPQFTDPAAGAMTAQLFTLGMTFALISLALFTAMIFCIAPLGDWLRHHPAFPKWQARITGSVLGGMAAWLAFDEP